jgi:hypothetical protein
MLIVTGTGLRALKALGPIAPRSKTEAPKHFILINQERKVIGIVNVFERGLGQMEGLSAQGFGGGDGGDGGLTGCEFVTVVCVGLDQVADIILKMNVDVDDP